MLLDIAMASLKRLFSSLSLPGLSAQCHTAESVRYAMLKRRRNGSTDPGH
jgi:hypothetical protein